MISLYLSSSEIVHAAAAESDLCATCIPLSLPLRYSVRTGKYTDIDHGRNSYLYLLFKSLCICLLLYHFIDNSQDKIKLIINCCNHYRIKLFIPIHSLIIFINTGSQYRNHNNISKIQIY